MSKYEFKLPDIGEGIAEGTVGEWHVAEGDTVQEDGDLVQIENDKSVEEIPSPVTGKITKILVPEGETAEVGQTLVEIETEGGAAADTSADDSAAEQPAAKPEAKQAPAAPQAAPAQPTKFVAQDHSVPVLAMPAVRRYARENNVDLTQIKGTGNHGQVTKADVDAVLAGGQAQAAAPQAQPASQPVQPVAKQKQTASLPAGSADWPQHQEKMSPVRKATALAMERAVEQIPHVRVFDEVVVDKLWDHRKQYKQLAADKGVHLTFLPYVVKALAVVLHEFPAFNAQVDMNNYQIVYNDFVNIGIATDTDNGLFVPIVPNADHLSLFDIAKVIADNTQRAKAGKLTAADMSHASMSITNIGSVGGGFFTPIINWPEVAILGIGRISEEPVVSQVGGTSVVKPAHVLKLSLAFDHRIIDGATAQKAVNRLKELLADPQLLLMEG